MASCQECLNYESQHGPLKSSYCRAFGAKINDHENESGGQQFAEYWGMRDATRKCPHGRPHPDFD